MKGRVASISSKKRSGPFESFLKKLQSKLSTRKEGTISLFRLPFIEKEPSFRS